MIKSKMSLNKDQRIIRLIVSAILLLVLLFFSLFDPLRYPLNSCGFKNLFGIPCPSCGLSRSAYATAHFHLLEALQLNLMGPVIFLFVFAGILIWSFESITAKQWISLTKPWKKIMVLIFFGSWFFSWIYSIL